MKRYILFAGWNGYPLGGMMDANKSGDNLEDLVLDGDMLIINESVRWYHIFDTIEGEVVKEGGKHEARANAIGYGEEDFIKLVNL